MCMWTKRARGNGSEPARDRENETAARFRCSNYFCSRSLDDEIGPLARARARAKLTHFIPGEGAKRGRALEIRFSGRPQIVTRWQVCTLGLEITARTTDSERKSERASERRREIERKRKETSQSVQIGVARGDATVPGIIIIDHELRRLREHGGLYGLAVPICQNIHYCES